jgi:hypothetical protein
VVEAGRAGGRLAQRCITVGGSTNQSPTNAALGLDESHVASPDDRVTVRRPELPMVESEIGDLLHRRCQSEHESRRTREQP